MTAGLQRTVGSSADRTQVGLIPPSLRVAMLATLLVAGAHAIAQQADAAATVAAAPSAESMADAYALRASRIRQLMAGELDPSVDPGSLFTVALDDPVAVQVEATRLALLIKGYGPEAGDPIWKARLELDRAQQAFLSASEEQRAAWLRAHAEQPGTGSADQAQREAEEASARARQAEAERANALAQAERSRSEAMRIVSEERARLLGLRARISAREGSLSASEAEFSRRAERTLALRRKVRLLADGPVQTQVADPLYDELRAWLRETRDLLAARLSAWPPPILDTHAAVDDLAGDLVPEADRGELLQLRTEVGGEAERLQVSSRRVAEQQMSQLYNAMLSLNEDRLELLHHLSGARRDSLTGFSSAGLDQAVAELRQVALVARYHLHRITLWVVGGQYGQLTMGRVGALVGLLFKIALSLAVFLWLRRLTRQYLETERARLEGLHAHRLYGGSSEVAVGIGIRVLAPASWLALVLLAWWLMPDQARSLMESRLLLAMLLWSIGGWLAVVAFDSVAEHRSRLGPVAAGQDNDVLRMRSLRLVGVLVVAAGLILSVTGQIVGSGTVYSWVVSICWLMPLPVGLLLAGWWREATLARLAHLRHHNAFEAWLLGHQSGWRGRIATVVAAAYLFVRGAVLLLREWVGQFDLTRRLLAYVFRRNLDRIGERRAQWSHQQLPDSVRARLSPATASSERLEVADIEGGLDSNLRARLGHENLLVALVGERGSGRTTQLASIAEQGRRLVRVECPFGGFEALCAQLAQAAGVVPGVAIEDLLAKLGASRERQIIIIDDAHRLVRPIMGGIADLDRLLDLARRHVDCAWVLSFESVVWQFYARARAADLLFDSVIELPRWSDGDIGRLLESRCRQADLQPDYELLLPADAVKLDAGAREDALRDAARSYCRMIWDYSDGNPGVALQAWVDSLAQAPDGHVVVTPFEAPDMAVFERLPEQGIFVLRAVLQLERALPADIAAATRRSSREISEVLHHGITHGYVHEVDGRYAISWIWYRPLTRFLQRLHLLSND